jgi:hypothetical protein
MLLSVLIRLSKGTTKPQKYRFGVAHQAKCEERAQISFFLHKSLMAG